MTPTGKALYHFNPSKSTFQHGCPVEYECIPPPLYCTRKCFILSTYVVLHHNVLMYKVPIVYIVF